MYPGPYEGTLERPFLVDRDGARRYAFPSATALWPSMQFDPAEFRDELAEHADMVASKADAFLFALRRDAGDAPPDLLGVALPDRVAFVYGSRSSSDLHVGWREAVIHSPLGMGLRRRLVLAVGPGEYYAIAFSRRAVSLWTLSLRSDRRAGGTWKHALVPERLVAVEPRRVRVRRWGDLAVWSASTPDSLLRVEVDRIPYVLTDPDADMHLLLDLYGDALREEWSTTEGEDLVGYIKSTRRNGDRFLVGPRDDFFFAMLVNENHHFTDHKLFRRPPEGWLPVVVHTDMHFGLRWCDLEPERKREAPPPVNAQTIPWKRVRVAERR